MIKPLLHWDLRSCWIAHHLPVVNIQKAHIILERINETVIEGFGAKEQVLTQLL